MHVFFLHAGTHANDWIGRRSLEPGGGGITVMHEKLHEQAGPSSGAFAAMDVADRHRRTVGHSHRRLRDLSAFHGVFPGGNHFRS